jgi:ubiquinol-cytochrome c reductase cytochrome b subunit
MTLAPFPWKAIKWGAWALLSLYVSLLSGILVGLQYDYATAFYSTTAIDLLVPYGRFFRSLHFYSSQFFLFFSCIHLAAVYWKSAKFNYWEWIQLTSTLPIILFLLFTGYILRGDNTGASAGMIAESIIHEIPLLGPILNDLFFSVSDSGLRKVYVHHVITFDFLLLICAWNHLRMYRVNIGDYRPLVAAMFIFSIFVAAPLELEQPGATYIAGPWFFLGLQELLRSLHPLVAGVAVPGIFVAALFAARPGSSRRQLALAGMAVWVALYAVFSCIAWFR